jgi:hypothetical protein
MRSALHANDTLRRPIGKPNPITASWRSASSRGCEALCVVAHTSAECVTAKGCPPESLARRVQVAKSARECGNVGSGWKVSGSVTAKVVAHAAARHATW